MNKFVCWCRIIHINVSRGYLRWLVLLVGVVWLLGCASPALQDTALPTAVALPTATALPLAATSLATATISPMVQSAATLFFADTVTTNLIIQHDQLSQTVVLSATIDFVAIRDDGAQIAVQTHDDTITILNLADMTRRIITSRCDSMIWAPDGQSLLCGRHGNIYTIQSDGQSDRLTTIAESPNAYSEFSWRPKSTQLWFALVTDTTSKICTTSATALECVGNGQQPRWSPSGQWLAYRLGDRVTIQSADASQQYTVTGMRVDNLLWINDVHLLIISNTRIMQYIVGNQQLVSSKIGLPTWRLIGISAPIR